jgi:hypothetical protein
MKCVLDESSLNLTIIVNFFGCVMRMLLAKANFEDRGLALAVRQG